MAGDQPFDPEHPDANPIVDGATFTQLADIVGTGPDGIGDLFETFTSNAPDTLSQMRSSAESGNLEQLSKSAHKLKGEAGTFGARRLQAYCKSLELDARDGDVDDPVARVETVEALYSETVADIQERL